MRQGWTVKGAVVAASLFAILLRGETEGVVQRIHVSAAAGASGKGTSTAPFSTLAAAQVRQQVSWRHYILAVKSVAKAAANRTEIRLADTPEWMAPDFVGFKSFAPVVSTNADWTAYPLAQMTVAEAGLEPAYRDLLARLPTAQLPNTPPRVSVEAPRTVSLLANVRLRGQVSDDGFMLPRC